MFKRLIYTVPGRPLVYMLYFCNFATEPSQLYNSVFPCLTSLASLLSLADYIVAGRTRFLCTTTSLTIRQPATAMATCSYPKVHHRNELLQPQGIWPQ